MVEDDLLVNYKDDSELDYEDDYHSHSHKNLMEDEEYYRARAVYSRDKYFKGEVKRSDNVLEYGCGLGQNIYLLDNAYGYDISKFALMKAKEYIKILPKLEGLKSGYFCMKGRINFDVVFSRHMLEHSENPPEDLKKMAGVLRPGGKLILVLPMERHWKVPLSMSQNQHLYAWNFQTINNLLIKNGFQPVSNKVLRASGYKKLLWLRMISDKAYYLGLYLAALWSKSREMKIVAIKI